MNSQRFLKHLRHHKLRFGLTIEEIIASSLIASASSFIAENEVVPLLTFITLLGMIAILKNLLEKNFTYNFLNYRKSFRWVRILDEKSLHKNRK